MPGAARIAASASMAPSRANFRANTATFDTRCVASDSALHGRICCINRLICLWNSCLIGFKLVLRYEHIDCLGYAAHYIGYYGDNSVHDNSVSPKSGFCWHKIYLRSQTEARQVAFASIRPIYCGAKGSNLSSSHCIHLCISILGFSAACTAEEKLPPPLPFRPCALAHILSVSVILTLRSCFVLSGFCSVIPSRLCTKR